MMADDDDYKVSPESEQPEYSNNSGGVWRIATATVTTTAECGLGDSDDEEKHHHRDKFRGERSEYYSRSVKDWVDSTTQRSNKQESGRTNSEDELEYSSISSKDSFDEAQYCDDPISPGQASQHSHTKDATIANGDDHLEYSSISSKESLHDDDEFSSTDNIKPNETTDLPGTVTKNNLPTEGNQVANGNDQLEYSSISSRESLHDEDDEEKSSDLDDLADPPTPTASAGSSVTGLAKETDLPKDYTVIDVDALEYSSISSKESLDDDQSKISNDPLPGHDLINSPDHLSEASEDQDSEMNKSPEPKVTAQECTVADNDDKLEDLSSSPEDCIDEVHSIGEDWNDQVSRSPEASTHTHTSKKEDCGRLSPDLKQENHHPLESGDNDQESNLSDIDQQMECIDEVHSSSEEELPEHLPSSPGQTISVDQDMDCTENKGDNESCPDHYNQERAGQQITSDEKDKEYPNEDNIAKVWMVVNGQTSSIKGDLNRFKFNITKAIKLRHHVLLQVRIAYTCLPSLRYGAFAFEMAQDSTWTFNRVNQRWEAILCQGGQRRASCKNLKESWKGDVGRLKLDRIPHRPRPSTKTTPEKGDNSIKSKNRQHTSVEVDHERESSLISGHRSKNYHPDANNISKAWIIIDSHVTKITSFSKTKSIINAALKYRRHVRLQVQLSASTPKVSLGAFITRVARRAKWKYIDHDNVWEASLGWEKKSQMEKDSELQLSMHLGRLEEEEPEESSMLTFKAFMEQCDDSITEVEALRKYSEYKTKFGTQQHKTDVNTNEEEEWMVVEEWRDDLKDGDEESGVDDRVGHVPSHGTLPDHDHSVGRSSAAEREEQRDPDCKESTSENMGSRLPSPVSEHTQIQSGGATRTNVTVVASPPQEPQSTPPRLDTDRNTVPDVSSQSPIPSSQQLKDKATVTSPSQPVPSLQQPKDKATVTSPSQPGREVRQQRTRKPPQRYS